MNKRHDDQNLRGYDTATKSATQPELAGRKVSEKEKVSNPSLLNPITLMVLGIAGAATAATSSKQETLPSKRGVDTDLPVTPFEPANDHPIAANQTAVEQTDVIDSDSDRDVTSANLPVMQLAMPDGDTLIADADTIIQSYMDTGSVDLLPSTQPVDSAVDATPPFEVAPFFVAQATPAATGAADVEAGAAAAGATTAASTAAATIAEAAQISLSTILAAIGGIGLAAAAASGGSSSSTSSTTSSGTTGNITVGDGYISGANVWLDMNDNGIAGDTIGGVTDIKLGTTDANGTFSLTLTDAQKLHGLIAEGGTDTSTGIAFRGTFAASAGATIINPLTTLVQSIAQQSIAAGATAAQIQTAVANAQTQVLKALNLPSTVDLQNFDSIKGTVSTDGITISQSQSIEIQAKALMVANILSAGTAALQGAATVGGETVNAAVTQTLSNQMVLGLARAIQNASDSDAAINLCSAATMQEVITAAATGAKATLALDDTVVTNSGAAAAGSVSAANQMINLVAGSAAQSAITNASATDSSIIEALTQMLQAQSVVQSTVANALDDGTAAAAQAVNTNYTSLANVLTAANQVTTDLNLTGSVNADTARAADTVAPVVSSVTGSATTTPFNTGDLIEFKVNMSEGVVIDVLGGAPQLNITVAGSARTATFDPGRSTGNAVTFTYRVQSSDSDGSAAVTGLTLNGATFKDLAGNTANTTLNSVGTGWIVDNTAPTIAITSNNSFLSAGAAATITFTLSEAAATSTFTAADISVAGGTLGTLTQSINNPLIYTATLTPTTGSNTPATVKVASDTFTDTAGNANTGSNLIVVAVDTVAPQVLVKSNLASLKAGQTATITFELSKDATDFTSGDVTVSGGTLSNFAGSGKDYTATFTPSADGTATVSVAAASFTAVTNNNLASNTLSIAVDTAAPSLTITANDNLLSSGETATVTFDLSKEATSGTFAKDDITVSGGTLGALTQSTTDKTIYTAKFTPTADSTTAGSITVSAGKFTDSTGNSNTLGNLSLTVDTLKPTVSSVTDNVSGTASSATTNVAYTYTFSEAVTGLAATDFSVTNGSVSSITGSGTTYTVNFAPATGVASGNIVMTLKAGAVTDTNGNANSGSTNTSQAIDTLAPTVSVADNVSGTASSATTSIAYTYTFSETVTGLAANDFSVTNGTISSVSGSGTTWTVNVTPAADVASGTIGLTLNAAAVTDAVGNANAQSSSSLQAIDTKAPTVELVTDNVSGTANSATTNVAYTYTFSEAVTGLAVNDFSITNGTVSSVSGSGTSWTVNVTPTANTASGTIGLTLNAAAVTDAVGNANAQSSSSLQAIDTQAPAITGLSPEDNGKSLGLAANLVMTFGETVVKGTTGNIILYTGDGTVLETIAVTDSKISISGTGSSAQVSINPSVDLVKDQTYYVKIAAGALLDSAGNAYAGITDATTWNFTGAGATATIANIASDNIVNATEAASAISVSGTLTAEPAILAAFTANDFTSAILKPTSGSGDIALTNLVYDATAHTWTAQIASGALSGTKDYNLEVTFTGTQGAATGVVGFGSLVVRADTVVENPTVTDNVPQTANAATGSIAYTYTFSEAVTGLASDDFTVTNGTISAVTGSGATWTVNVTPAANAASGNVALTLKAGAVTDAAGNSSVTSTNNSQAIDTVPPSVTTVTDNISGTANSATTNIAYTYTFSEAVTGLASNDFTVTNGTISSVTGSGTAWTANVTPAANVASGNIGLTLNAAAVTDAAGNPNAVSSNNAQAIDTLAPTVSVTHAQPNTIPGARTFTFTFNEAVSGFTIDDISVANLTKGAFTTVNASTYTLIVTPTSSITTPVNATINIAAAAAQDLNGNTSSAAAEYLQSILIGTSSADILAVDNSQNYIVLVAGNDTIKLAAATGSTATATDFVADFASGDKLDLSTLLGASGAHYTSSAIGDPGTGFIELKNVTLTKDPANSWTVVNFDVNLDSSTINNSKIDGINLDLDYDTSKVIFSTLTSPKYSQGPVLKDVWSPLDGNYLSTDQGASPTGKIVMPANTAGTNPITVDATNNVLNVKLYVTGLVDTFAVAIQSKASGGTTDVLTANGVTTDVTVGVAKTAGATIGSTGTLEIITDTGTLGTVGDNQLHIVAVYDAALGGTHLEIKYDTDSIYGTGHTTASSVIAMDFAGDVTSLFPTALNYI